MLLVGCASLWRVSLSHKKADATSPIPPLSPSSVPSPPPFPPLLLPLPSFFAPTHTPPMLPIPSSAYAPPVPSITPGGGVGFRLSGVDVSFGELLVEHTTTTTFAAARGMDVCVPEGSLRDVVQAVCTTLQTFEAEWWVAGELLRG